MKSHRKTKGCELQIAQLQHASGRLSEAMIIMTVDDSASVTQMVVFTLRNAGYQEMIEALGGSVEVKNRKGEETAVTLKLPLPLAIIAEARGQRAGFAVDRVIGEHQTVIKTLSRLYRNLNGFSGTTILGDGTPAMILDLPNLPSAARRGPAMPICSSTANPLPWEPPPVAGEICLMRPSKVGQWTGSFPRKPSPALCWPMFED